MLSPLLRHPDSLGGEAFQLSVDTARPRPALLRLRYSLTGPMGELRLPEPAEPERRDGLWRHTCFEAFVQAPDGGYYEFNLAPSSEWAAYRFTGYRLGMAAADAEARISGAGNPRQYALVADIDLSRLPGMAAAAWRLGISAVLEDRERRISYWAIRHPAGKADFHHPDSFALELAQDA
jgi:hypothetical protein